MWNSTKRENKLPRAPLAHCRNLQSRTDLNGKTTTFTYDDMRRLRTKVPDASLNQPTISFTYNANGQRATMTDASGQTVYSYDVRNRLRASRRRLAR